MKQIMIQDEQEFKRLFLKGFSSVFEYKYDEHLTLNIDYFNRKIELFLDLKNKIYSQEALNIKINRVVNFSYFKNNLYDEYGSKVNDKNLTDICSMIMDKCDDCIDEQYKASSIYMSEYINELSTDIEDALNVYNN